MRILFIGYSNVLKRRILPFIHELKSIDKVDIARYESQQDEIINYENISGKVYNSYDEALKESKADIAYISTVNSAHALWAEKALKKGMHVIVDKPAFLSLDKTIEIVNLAEKLRLGISESIVYPFHSQIHKVNEILEGEKLSPTNLTINFSFPPMPPENFRYRKDLGGGAFNDLGPYVVTPGRLFFKEEPVNIASIINTYDKENEVETSFSILAEYSRGRSMIGNFGFNSEYINRLNVSGENFLFEINRVFTPPNDLENEILLKMNNSSRLIKTEKSNCFINFLEAFIESISNGQYPKYASMLITDAKSMELLKRNVLNRKV